MNRITGSTTISLNVDVLASGPWDARSIIPFFSGLTDSTTLPYPYAGMVVTVYNDSDVTKNGIYYCSYKGGNIEFADSSSVWVKSGGGDGLTGGTLNLTGATIDFSGATTGFSVSNINFVTGLTVTNNSISGLTNTGNTSGGVITAITGGSYTDGTITFAGSGPFSSTISGFDVLSGTGVDISYINNANNYGLKIDATNQQISFRLNNGSILSAYTGSLKDYYVTGGTYSGETGVVRFFNTSGGSFEVSGFTSGLTNYYTTGATYNDTTGIITFNRTDLQPAYSATGFNYVTGFTIYPDNTISGMTNTGDTYGGIINAVTGGSFLNNTLYLSGTGNILSGISITGFSTQVGTSIYTGGTSTAGTGGTTDITGTLIESGQTTGVTFSLSGALSFTNSNVTKREVGGIGDGSNFFSNGKTLQEIIQQIFYPVDAPTITNIGKTLTNSGTLSSALQIVGTTGSVILNATYTSGTSVTNLGTKRTGPVSSFVFSGYTQPSPAVTGFTTNSTTAYTVNSNYTVVRGYNTWTCNINYSVGEQPVYDDGSPYYGAGVNQFIQAGTVTPSNVTIEGVYPVSATTTTGDLSIFTQQTLVSMITNTPLTITLAAENSSSFRQSFILPQDLDTKFSSLGLYNSLTGNYDPVTILSLFTKTTYGTITIGGDNVTYYRYTYKIPDLTGQSIYKLTFS